MTENTLYDEMAQQAFIKSASIHILTALIHRSQDKDNTLVPKSINMAYALNEELVKRFKQKL